MADRPMIDFDVTFENTFHSDRAELVLRIRGTSEERVSALANSLINDGFWTSVVKIEVAAD